MIKFILVAILKMFMGFVGITLTDDVEVYTIPEAQVEVLQDMEYEVILDKELYYGKDEEYYINFVGMEADNGSEYYTLVYESDEFDFELVSDEKGNVLYYTITRY